MKTLFTLIILIAAGSSYCQITPKLPVKVKFKDDIIIITLPPQYQSPEFMPMVKPGTVDIMFTQKMQEYNPSKGEMLKILVKELSKEPTDASNNVIYEYLSSIVTFIFLSNNTIELPETAKLVIDKWIYSNVGFNSEIKLVKDYILFSNQSFKRKPKELTGSN